MFTFKTLGYERLKIEGLADRGQTMVEYVLIVAVVIAVAIGVFQRIGDFLINNPDSFQNRYINGFQRVFLTNRDQQGNPSFKQYRIPR